MGAGYGNPPNNFEPPITPAKTEVVKKHRRWVVHSHEATRPQGASAMSDINITPLIDVLLVLLIIFMVVTPVVQRGLDIALPQADTSNQQQQPNAPTNQVVLGLEDSPSGVIVTVNKKPFATMDDLTQELRDHYQTRTDKTIFIRASGTILYGRVVEAMDAAKAAGVERIGIISETMIEQAGGAVGGSPGQ
jgi:biopolymer transport protein TolR